MIQTGIFGPLLDQMRWLQRNYSGVNVVPYGSIIGGYGGIFEGAKGIEIPIRLGLVICMALPAILPVLGLAAWAVQLVRKRVEDKGAILYLLACVVALVVATLPRPDVMHLAFAAVPAYAVAGIWVSRYSSVRAAAALFACLATWAGLFGIDAAGSFLQRKSVTSPVGRLRVRPEHEADVRRLFATVRPGDKLYVHPYMPLLYFLTQARNPTRFSFLAPGMMTLVEEAVVLSELSNDPPKWVLYLPLAREEWTRMFPAAKYVNPRFEKLEQWMQENYEPYKDPISLSGYSLWVRKPGASGI